MQPSLNDFPLAWRWTKLDSALRDQIAPLKLERAAELHARAEHLWKPRGPIRRWETIGLTDIATSDVADWLRAHLPAPVNARVALSWDQRMAATVPQSLFVKRWDDFCYPSSDDVFICPADESWLLVYRHWEQFEFGLAAV